MITSSEIRSTFLEYFRSRGHEVVPSSPLVPADDPTLLFTNSGMVQFKDVFLGRESRGYVRATTAQRCVRAGGKHNDLENVGYTARHHTFFEMLGNFSFGDYFKREAIHYSWELLTKGYGLPVERLWITVYETDDEAHDIWVNAIGVRPERVIRIGDRPEGGSDNFWQMGETGPCGPCTEIFYDHGPEVAGGPPGSPDEDGDRYIEIWNLVFMQFDRAPDGTLTPLPKPSVDTGMGLERLAAVLQGVHSNYEIDLFRRLISAAADVIGTSELDSSSLKVVADHIRSTAFLIVDGVLPSNEGRGYVLRRILRRAIRHGYKLGARDSFFHKLVAPLVAEMGAAYPELRAGAEHVTRVIAQEERRFAETLEHGMRLLEADLSRLQGRVIPGDTIFRLYDTYGFPVDLTGDIARERGLGLDLEGFDRAMAEQRARARAASHFGADYHAGTAIAGHTEFCGYDRLQEQARIRALFRDGKPVARLDAGQSGTVVLERTPFYAESGGQVGDRGRLESSEALFRVDDTRKQGTDIHLHLGALERGTLRVGDTVSAQVDGERRRATMLNHSATHLLHAALREALGGHVLQKGSLVEPERLRFDFAHYQPLTAGELESIERLVNARIRANDKVQTQVMPFDQAVAAGAIALFGEKYGEHVRVLRMGDFSTELCGGTHVQRTGDIGLFKVTGEGGIAAGIRRIEAITGEAALAHVETAERMLGQIAQLVRGEREGIEERVRQLLDRNRRLERELEQLKARLASTQGDDLAALAEDVGGIKVLAAQLDGADVKTLRETVDRLKDRLASAAVVLASVEDGKVRLVAGVTRDQTARIRAGDLVNQVAQQVGGRGGGRPDMATAGGTDPEALEAALRGVTDWVRAQIG